MLREAKWRVLTYDWMKMGGRSVLVNDVIAQVSPETHFSVSGLPEHETDPEFCTKARENLMLAGMVISCLLPNDRACHQNVSERVKTQALSMKQQTVKQHLSVTENPT